ncbi:MAG: hypothetical protein ACE5EQ_11320 [Phycisphaerae bacterium]
MANYTCPSCRQTFHDEENLDGPCIFCGHLLNEFRPAPRHHPGRIDLVNVARVQRWLLRLLPLAVACDAAVIFAPSFKLLGVEGFLFFIPVPLIMLGLVIVLLSLVEASGGISILYLFLMFIPGINILVWFEVNARATEVLKRAGVRVGVLGARDLDVRSIIDATLCSGCGYNLTGNVSGRCSECGKEIPRT